MLTREPRERLARKQALAKLLGTRADGVILRDVHTAIGRRHFQQDLAERDLRW